MLFAKYIQFKLFVVCFALALVLYSHHFLCHWCYQQCYLYTIVITFLSCCDFNNKSRFIVYFSVLNMKLVRWWYTKKKRYAFCFPPTSIVNTVHACLYIKPFCHSANHWYTPSPHHCWNKLSKANEYSKFYISSSQLHCLQSFKCKTRTTLFKYHQYWSFPGQNLSVGRWSTIPDTYFRPFGSGWSFVLHSLCYF